MKVLAAMSGGVDSAVAAARAVEAGHDVTGVHLALSKNPQTYRSGARGCCSKEDAHDARRAADVLGIPFYVWDLSDRFAADVVNDFVAEYAAGRTPNPCLRCNEKIKFSAVLDRGVALGFDAVCTGHYARLIRTGKTSSCIGPSTPPRTSRTCWAYSTMINFAAPTFRSGLSRKADVRAEARDRGLAVADKPDSHDICFIANGDTAGFLEQAARHAARRHRGRHRREGRRACRFASIHRRAAAWSTARHACRRRPAAFRAGDHADDQHHHRRSARCARGQDHQCYPAHLDR